MKLNWKTFKVVFASAVIIGAIFWAVDSVRTRSYSGTNLNFVVGHGPVTMTNTSGQPVSVQLVSPGSRAFSVSSAIEGAAGASVKQGTGSSTTQLIGFDLPTGVSEFTVVRGSGTTTDVNFVANPAPQLQAAAQPLSSSDSRTTVIVAAVVIAAALFYISRTTSHHWINTLRGIKPSALLPAPITDTQAAPMRSYGDNRADISEK